MSKKPIFKYENGHATCIATDNMGRVFKGEAWCAPEDMDLESALTGSSLAEARAQIAAAVTYRNDIKIKLKALYQLYYSMNRSKYFNKKSYENKMLWRQIHLLENDLAIAQHQLAVLKLELFEFMQDKEIMRNKIRERRNGQK